MNTTQQDLDKGQIKLTIEVSVTEAEPYLDRVTHRLAHTHQIPGFRPGKAPHNVIRQAIGEDKIYEEAMQELVTKTLYDVLKERNIETVGQPNVSVEKLAPGNPIIFSATVSVVPTATLSKWKDIKVVSIPTDPV